MGKFKVGDRVRVVDNMTPCGGPIKEYPVGSVMTIERTCLDGDGHTAYLFNGHCQYLKEFQVDAALTIQAGKFYKTRDGRKVGPMEHWNVYDGQFFHAPEGDFYDEYWQENGVNGEPHIGQDDSLDLIAEWVDEPGAVHKFKVGDRVRVSCGHGWDGHGTIESIDKGWDCIVVEMDDGRTGGFSGRHIHSFEPVAVAPATAAPEVEIEVAIDPTPAVGSPVLIPGWITSINHSPKWTVYGIAFETKNRRVSLHFLEEDFVLDDEGGCPCAENDNGALPTTYTAKAFEALGDWLRAVAINPSAAFRSNKEAA